ncbi:MAG: hypothetical protein ABFS22_14230, partial [Pseudomonadota bacterium]
SLIYLLLAGLLAVAAYFPGLSGDYAFDDMQNLLSNPRLSMKELDLETLQTASFSSGAGKLKRPVSMFTFALNRYWFGINPWSYKVINLAIHLLTGIALFWLATLMLRQYRRLDNASLSPRAETWLPVIITAVWLVHPLNLTSVLYIVQRMTSLAALFTVLGLCCYVLGRSRLLENRRGWPWIFAGLFGFGGLAVFSKENGILLPGYMFIIELALFRFRGVKNNINKPVAVFFTLFLLLPGLLFLLLLVFQPGTFLAGYDGRDFTLTERIMTESRVLVFYLTQIVAPSVSELGLYHDDIRISHSLLDPATTLYSMLALTLLFTVALGLLKKMPLAGLGMLWFFCGHALESTILPLEIAHEHRNYLADFGIILALGSLVAQIPGRRLAPHIRTVVPGLFIALLAYTTWVRAGQWSDNVNHAIYEAVHHPESPRSVYAAGRIHARLALNGHEDSIEKAYYYLGRASELDYSGILPDIVMVKLAFMLDLPVKQEWYDRIIFKLAEYPINAADLNGLHALSSCQQNVCKTPRATMELIYATVLQHESLRSAGGRHAHAATSYGFYLINVHGEFDQGLGYFYQAVERKPDVVQNWINLINVLVAMHRYDEAGDRLGMFQAENIAGATDRDFNRLAGVIADGRAQLTRQTGQPDTHTVVENQE